MNYVGVLFDDLVEYFADAFQIRRFYYDYGVKPAINRVRLKNLLDSTLYPPNNILRRSRFRLYEDVSSQLIITLHYIVIRIFHYFLRRRRRGKD